MKKGGLNELRAAISQEMNCFPTAPEAVYRALERLLPLQEYVLRGRYGVFERLTPAESRTYDLASKVQKELHPNEFHTLEEVGEVIERSREGVRQQERKAICKLQKELNPHGPNYISPRTSEWLELPVSAFELPVAARGVLYRLSVRRVSDLMQYSIRELRFYKRCGPEVARAIIGTLLTPAGLSLPELPVSPPGTPMMERRIREFPLSERARSALARLGISKIEDFKLHRREEFYMRNCGRTTRHEIYDTLIKPAGLTHWI